MDDEDDYDEGDDSDVDAARLEAAYQRMLDNPMPDDLASQIAAEIEPHTLDCEIKHRDVMTAIGMVFPTIRDWLAAQPG